MQCLCMRADLLPTEPTETERMQSKLLPMHCPIILMIDVGLEYQIIIKACILTSTYPPGLCSQSCRPRGAPLTWLIHTHYIVLMETCGSRPAAQ